MLTNKQSITIYFKKVIDDIKRDQSEKGMVASGRSAGSLRFTVTPNEGKLFGANYFRHQREGRGPGGFPPIQALEDWIRAKGIQPDTTIEYMAFAIAKKMAQRGSDIFQGKKPGLDLDGIIERNLPLLAENLLKGTVERITKRL